MLFYFLISAEQEQQDFITCGDCQHEFKLCDIVKFIQHKVNGCNKENVDPYENNDPADDSSEGAEAVSLIGNRRTSISAPIANRGTPELRDKSSPRPSRELPSTATSVDGAKSANNSSHNNDEDDDDSNEDDENEADDDLRSRTSSRRKKKSVSTNESNGPNQGQSNFCVYPLHSCESGNWDLNKRKTKVSDSFNLAEFKHLKANELFFNDAHL